LYKPVSSLTDDLPIEFVVPGQGEEYIDLPHTMLSISVQIRSIIYKETSKDKNEIDNAGPVIILCIHYLIKWMYFLIKNLYPPA